MSKRKRCEQKGIKDRLTGHKRRCLKTSGEVLCFSHRRGFWGLWDMNDGDDETDFPVRIINKKIINEGKKQNSHDWMKEFSVENSIAEPDGWVIMDLTLDQLVNCETFLEAYKGPNTFRCTKLIRAQKQGNHWYVVTYKWGDT